MTQELSEVSVMGELSRFRATPQEIHECLMKLLAEDVYLAFQQWIGAAAVREACDGIRDVAADADVRAKDSGPLGGDEGGAVLRGAALIVDPDYQGGPWPSVLVRRFGVREPGGDLFASRGHGRCGVPAQRGTGLGVCDQPLDTSGRVQRPGAHLEKLAGVRK